MIHHKKNLSLVLVAIMAVCLALPLAGCSQNPSSPNTTTDGTEPISANTSTKTTETTSTNASSQTTKADNPSSRETTPESTEALPTAKVSEIIWLPESWTEDDISHSSLASFGEECYLFLLDGENPYHLLTYSGELIGTYKSIDNFSDGLARVEADGKFGYINISGQLIIPAVYDEADTFIEGLARVQKDGYYGYIDTIGQIVIPIEYTKIDAFTDGLARVEKDEYYGYVDTTGQIVIPIEYTEIGAFTDGLAYVRKNWLYGYINTTGELVIPLDYTNAHEFSNGLARVQKWLNDEGRRVDFFIDATGEISISWENYEECANFSEGFAAVFKDGKCGYIDTSGNISIPLEYEFVTEFYHGLAAVKKDGKYGYIDTAGNIIIPFEYLNLLDSVAGVNNYERPKFLMKDGMEYCIFFDDAGAPILINPTNHFNYVSGTGLMPIEKDGKWDYDNSTHIDGKWGYVDYDTQMIILPLEYDEVGSFSDGLVYVKKDGKYGYSDTAGNIVIPLEYDNAQDFSHGVAKVEKDGDKFYIDSAGQIVAREKDFINRLGIAAELVSKNYNDATVIRHSGEVSNMNMIFVIVKKENRLGFCTVSWPEE